MKNNKGMTIVEVMVAFVLLMIGLGGLFKATQFSANLITSASSTQNNVDQMMIQYYSTNPPAAETQTVNFTADGYNWSMNMKNGEYTYSSADGDYAIRYYSGE